MKMQCFEYHDVPLEEADVLREGQKEVWFANLVPDVYTQILWFVILVSTLVFG
jgi:hypothetical protein